MKKRKKKMLSRLGGRKVFGFILILAASVYIELTKDAGISQNLVMLLGVLYTAFVAGNVAVKKKGAKSSGSLDADKIRGEMKAEIEANVAQVYKTVEGVQSNMDNVKKTLGAVAQQVITRNNG
jgi:hypothetical protein